MGVRVWLAGVVACVAFAASCSSTPTTPGNDLLPPPSVNAARVCSALGPEGGSLAHPAGSQLVVPPGALATPTSLCMTGIAAPATDALGGPALAQGYELTPDGQTFRKPVDVIVPFDPARLPTGGASAQVQVEMAPQGTRDFVHLQSTVDFPNRMVRAQTTHFTQFVPAFNPNPILITTTSPPLQATVGVAYSQSFVATGGTPPYTLRATPLSATPPGLSMSENGVFGGTPSVAGDYAFFIVATDSANHSVAQAFGLTVVAFVNPVPSLTQISPTTVTQGSPTTTVTFTGSGFVPKGTALWDGTALSTTYVSPTSVTAAIPALNLASAGTHQLAVANPSPGGGTSDAVAFTITAVPQNPAPTVASVSPSQLPTSGVDAVIHVMGSNFVASSSVTIGAQGISTQYVSATELTASIPAAYLSAPGTLAIGAFTPPPGGGFAATTVPLTVGSLNPAPTLLSLAPSSVVAGSAAFTLQATGSAFLQGGKLFFGATALATTVADAANASASVPADLVAQAGSVQVTFINPAPGGGSSGPLPFTIAPVVDGGTGDATLDAGDATADAGGADDGGAVDAGGEDGGGALGAVVLASGLSRPDWLTLDSQNVYWTTVTGGEVMTCAKGGCNQAPRVLATGQGGASGITVDANTVYWASQSQTGGTLGFVASCAIGGCNNAPSVLASGQTLARAVAILGSRLVWINSSGPAVTTDAGTQLFGAVMTCDVAAGCAATAAPLAARQEGPTSLAIDSDSAFWMNAGTTSAGEVMSCPLTGCGPATAPLGGAMVVANNQTGDAIAVDAANIYWAGTDGSSGEKILTCPKTGCSSNPTALATGLPDVSGLTVDGTDLYWTHAGTGTIMKCPIGGCLGAPTTVIAGQNGPVAIATDANYIYWTNDGGNGANGSVMRLAKGLNPVPSLVSLSPQEAIAGSAFTLTVAGSGFAQNGHVSFGGTALATTVVSASSATADVPANLVSSAGLVSITFVNPTPVGGPSNTLTFHLGAALIPIGDVTCARSFGGSGSQIATSVAVDSDGSTVISGFFEGPLDFGTSGGALNGGTHNAPHPVFVAKLDASCTPQWSTKLATFGGQPALALDSTNNIIVSGSVGTSPNTGVGLAKLSPSGTLLWLKSFGATGDTPSSIAIDASDNILVTGDFRGAFSFFDGDAGMPPLSNGGIDEAFLAKLDGSGAVLWQRAFTYGTGGGGAQQHLPMTLAANRTSGTIALAGRVTGTIDFGGGTLTAGTGAPFVATFDTNGAYQWAKVYPGNALFNSMAVDGAGALVLGGALTGTIDFGLGALSSHVSGYSDVLLVKVNANGVTLWNESFGDPNTHVVQHQGSRGVVLDSAGNIVVAGTIEGTVDFGGGPLTSAGTDDFFLARFTPDGAWLGSRRYGDASNQSTSAIAAIPGGGIAFVGGFNGNLPDLGGVPLMNAVQQGASTGNEDVFAARVP